MLYLFDIDGTLLLSGGAGARALDRVFAERYQVGRAMDGVQPGGKTDSAILDEVFVKRLGRSAAPGEKDAVLAAYVPYLREEVASSSQFRLMPAVLEAIEFLAAQPAVALGLATGNIRLAAQVKLERAALWTRFSFGGFGCDSPDREEIVARAIDRGLAHARRALSRAEIVVVGDTPRDIAAARANGVIAVAVATGPSSDRATLARHRPDALLDTLSELPGWHASRCAS
jgi:phosphoglycolate phosphatase-like HAD superfamily hydrolase